MEQYKLKKCMIRLMWCCPWCRQVSPRHWNLTRHIALLHNSLGEPTDSVTGLTRLQKASYGDRAIRKLRQSYYRPSSWQSDSFPIDDIHNESYKEFWRLADRIKWLELLKQMQGYLATIIQQNGQIIGLLDSLFRVTRG
jgi:hypothetical protein